MGTCARGDRTEGETCEIGARLGLAVRLPRRLRCPGIQIGPEELRAIRLIEELPPQAGTGGMPAAA
jgi:hypothetical protein